MPPEPPLSHFNLSNILTCMSIFGVVLSGIMRGLAAGMKSFEGRPLDGISLLPVSAIVDASSDPPTVGSTN